MSDPKHYDYIVLGAGIVGLSIARELIKREPDAQLLVIEKEDQLGRHASGRNSGVLHSGIYYPEGSLKAKVCRAGAKLMADYCDEYNLPIQHVGKVVVPIREEDDPQVDLLYRRAQANGVHIELIDDKSLKKIEPEARTASGRALYSPDTAIVESLTILNHIKQQLVDHGVLFRYSSRCSNADSERSVVHCDGGSSFGYGHLYNATGAYADRIAKMFGVGTQYTLIPFKGSYYKLRPDADVAIRGLVYPVPNLDVPFLGVHSVKNIKGDTYFGPSAMPALGREHYRGLEGLNISEVVRISWYLLGQLRYNKQGFRKLLREESARMSKSGFASAARNLIPRVKDGMLETCDKVGIRPQLLDTDKRELVMDFLVEGKGNTTHVLNAISPAFTSAFSFADLVVSTSSGHADGF